MGKHREQEEVKEEKSSFLGFVKKDAKVSRSDVEVPDEVEEESFEDELEEEEKVNLPALIVHTPVADANSAIPIAVIDSPMNCDYCYLQERCAGYKVGGVCEFNYRPMVIKSPDEMVNKMVQMKLKLFEIQTERVVRAVHHEKTDGGVIDKTVSEEMERLNLIMNDVKEFLTPQQDSLSIQAKGNTVGIIQRIFGAGGDK